MNRIWRTLAACLFVSVLVILPAIGMAADFELFWDPNCNADADLEGYYIYYNEDASVLDDPSGAVDVYVAVTDIDFDPDNPSYLIADLLDDVRYCFAVTAWYGDEESDFSNEVCGINGTYVSDTDPVANAGGPYEVTDTDDSGSQAVALDGSASYDSDGTITSYQWFEAGTLIGTGVNPTLSFTVGMHTITLTVTDNDSATHSNDTSVIVNPAPNEIPVANAGGPYEATDADNSGSEAVALDGSASFDSDGSITGYQWYENGTLIGTGVSPTVSFAVGTHTVTLTVTDNDNATHSNDTTVTVNPAPPNEIPVADAGGPYEVTDTDDSGSEVVALDGSASWDSDGSITSYKWYEDGTLIGTGVSPTVSFAVGTHTVTLTVTDNDNATHSNDTTVTVNPAPPNEIPVADAGGPYEVTDTDDSGSEVVALDGSASWDSDGSITSYKWYENGTLIGTGVSPTVSFAVGTHTVALTVTDNDNATHSNSTTVVVNAAPNELPVANAGGPYEVTDTDNSGSEAVALDGSASFDSDGSITGYQWYEEGTLIGTGASSTVSFGVGTHTVTLTVTDNDNAMHSNSTTVVVNAAPNELPVADAGGPYEVTDTDNSGSEAVALDGSASFDSDGSITGYQWYENGTLIGSGVNPTLSFAVGSHTVTLTITDNDNATHSDETTVTVSSGPTNTPPNGVIESPAGNQTIYVGESVYFTGIGSDPDGDTLLSYRWQFGAGSGIDDYTIDDSPGDIFFHNAGTFTVTFAVTDSEGAADPTPDTRVITVIEKSVSGPIDKTDWRLVYVDSEELVTLDGAATNAFDGDSNTMWHTEWGSKDDPAHPHEIIIDLGQTYDLDGFSYEPYKRRGRIIDYEFFVGTGSSGPWTSVSSGAFSNGANVKSVSFAVTTGRYIRLVAYSEAKGGPWASAVEIGVTGTPH